MRTIEVKRFWLKQSETHVHKGDFKEPQRDFSAIIFQYFHWTISNLRLLCEATSIPATC